MDDQVKKILDNLGISINIDTAGVSVAGLKSCFKYIQDETSNIVQFSIDPEITRDQIKVKLVEPGTLQVEWPKLDKSEDIPVE